MLTSDAVHALGTRMIRSLQKLSPAQRDAVVIKILESDPDLATVLPALRSTIAAARRIQLPLKRDGVA